MTEQTGNDKALGRLQKLFDCSSFMEIGKDIRHRCTDFGMDQRIVPGDGVVSGYGTINGRMVFAYAQNEDVMGGSLGEAHASKICRAMDMAAACGAPIVALSVSSGARIQEGVSALSGYGAIFQRNTRYSGKILQISCILGPCAGGAVYSSALADFVVMAADHGRMFITGPEVARTVLGEVITAEDLGGATAHSTKSGCAHFIGKDENECLKLIRLLLDYYFNRLPSSFSLPRKNRASRAEWQSLLPENDRKPYDIRRVIRMISDDSAWMEYMEGFAKNMVAGFIRLGGRTIGIVGNQPLYMAGCIDIAASDKAARFIRTCDAHGIPLLSCVDVPGFIPGSRQEHNGIIRHGAKMLYAWSEAEVPHVTLILRKAYGGAYIAMGSRELGADAVIAWPQAKVAVMGAEAAARILFRKEQPAEQARKTEEYVRLFSGPEVAAQRGFIDKVIMPEDTRTTLLRLFAMLGSKSVQSHHGNIPL